MKEIRFSFGRAAKWDGYPDIEPRYGYNWFFWFPRLHGNGGRLWRNEVVDCSLSWLYFWVGITVWPFVSQEKADCAVGTSISPTPKETT